eukprot:CAMPEP_0201587166 /NCGR_PEP_ID=MMETSP0190_2-20130828/140957_1 /ASSEMBLY_ACC=CAM_ASM_000263 /TAXON_ID=37353 /ORGANISM="Rosalina sp." /LENGTH=263 /DNA_ID=CAMNT_0048036665 /DNA_START=265 /DNA_END=1056 /DNA_ORIENTATION=+
MFENYRRDRDRLTIRSFEDNDDNKNKSRGDKRSSHSTSNVSRLTHHPPPTNPLLLTHHPSMALHRPPPGIGHHPHGAPLMLPPYAAHHRHPGLPHPPHPAAYPYPYPSPTRPELVAAAAAAAATFPPPAATATPTAATSTNKTATEATAGTAAPATGAPPNIHPERAAMTASTTTTAGRRPPLGDYAGGAYGRYQRRDEQELRDASMYEDQYGRKIPIHYQEPATRTRRSYREVDVEFPADEVEEEIDYGFGDFVKNPTKFNL